MYTVDDIANWYIAKAHRSNVDLSPKKLQKLLYFSYAWVLVFYNKNHNELERKLFDNAIEAWVGGPTIPEIHRHYKGYGEDPITKTVTAKTLTEDVEDTLNQVWDIYGEYTGNQLASIAQQEEPWLNARGHAGPLDASHTPLDDQIIFAYYLNKYETE